MTIKTLTLLALLALTLLAVGGCATLFSDDSAQGRLAVQYATLKAIDGQPERAEKVRGWVKDARSYVESGDSVTIARLDEGVRERINWSRLDPADRLLIEAILTEARARLEGNLSRASLAPDQRVKLLTVLDWVEGAAR